MLANLNETIERPVGREDVIATFAGIRPLAAIGRVHRHGIAGARHRTARRPGSHGPGRQVHDLSTYRGGRRGRCAGAAARSTPVRDGRPGARGRKRVSSPGRGQDPTQRSSPRSSAGTAPRPRRSSRSAPNAGCWAACIRTPTISRPRPRGRSSTSWPGRSTTSSPGACASPSRHRTTARRSPIGSRPSWAPRSDGMMRGRPQRWPHTRRRPHGSTACRSSGWSPMPWWRRWEGERERERMVAHQLRDRGIRDERVLDAFRQVPREAFVDPGREHSAYHDRPLDIGRGQTISQPWVVAVMLEALELHPTDRLLEVGVGSGYAIALASLLVGEAYGVERVPELADAARERLGRLGFGAIDVRTGDGTTGLPAAAPFDAILVSAGGREVPAALITQLASGGRMVIPVGGELDQDLLLVSRHESGEVHQRSLGPVRFVPLIGDAHPP